MVRRPLLLLTLLAPAIAFADVKGRVRLTGTHPPVARIAISKDTGACGTSMPDESILAGAGGELANVVVWSSEGSAVAAEDAPPAVVDQKACRFVPRVTVLRAGQKILLANSDRVMHTTHGYRGADTAFNYSLPTRNIRIPVKLATPGILELKCDAGHDWMHGWVHVIDSPYFAVTGSDGRFSISGLPPGAHVLHVWHETLGEKFVTVHVSKDGSAPESEIRF